MKKETTPATPAADKTDEEIRPVQRGGKREGAGRKVSDNPLGKAFNVRLSPQQRAKLERLGGAAWIRQQIDAA